MQDAALFFRQRAYACFCRRRRWPVLSEAWRREVADARWFIRACRAHWEHDQPHEILHTCFALGSRAGIRRLERGEAMTAIADRAARRPVFDPRRPDEIIGYNALGLPE